MVWSEIKSSGYIHYLWPKIRCTLRFLVLPQSKLGIEWRILLQTKAWYLIGEGWRVGMPITPQALNRVVTIPREFLGY